MNSSSNNSRSGRGFTLVEILVVIAILGVLATVVLFSVRGVKEKGDETACVADSRTLTDAGQAYMAQTSVNAIPALGSSDDRYELFLVDVGLLNQVSTSWNLNADGTVTTTGEPCI